jgi:hypothetical protein
MYMKSGAKNEVWMLSDGLGILYAKYREDFGNIMKKVVRANHMDGKSLRQKVHTLSPIPLILGLILILMSPSFTEVYTTRVIYHRTGQS